jgi:hypothetical protein
LRILIDSLVGIINYMHSLKVFITISFTVLFFSSSFAQCIIHEDDFETGTIGANWTGLINLFQIDSTNPGSGYYNLTSNADFPSIYNGISFVFPDMNPTIFTFKLMSSNTNLTGSSTIILGDTLTNGQILSNGNGGLFFINFFNNKLRIIGDTTITYPASNNTWYDVFFDNFNWLFQTADLYINGVLVCQDMGFRSNMSSVSKIILSGGTQNNNNLTYSSWDMIQVGSTPTITIIDTTICYGENYTFTDGHTINNITNDTNYNSILIGPGICDIITNTLVHVHQNQFNFINDSISHCTNQQGDSTIIQADTNYLSYFWSDSSTSSHYISNSDQWVSLTVVDNFGCQGFDSIFTEMINIDTTINYAFSSFGGLFSSEINASFQWLDCNANLSPITNETNDTIHFPIQGGDFNYALEINKNGCVDTSSCHHLIMFSDEIQQLNQYLIKPNPFNDFIQISNLKENVSLMIYDLNGKLVYAEPTYSFLDKKIDLSILKKGYYLLILRNSSTTKKYPIIKY